MFNFSLRNKEGSVTLCAPVVCPLFQVSRMPLLGGRLIPMSLLTWCVFQTLNH